MCVNPLASSEAGGFVYGARTQVRGEASRLSILRDHYRGAQAQPRNRNTKVLESRAVLGWALNFNSKVEKVFPSLSSTNDQEMELCLNSLCTCGPA